MNNCRRGSAVFAVAVFALAASLFAQDTPATAPAPKTGLITTSFSARSPLSSIEELSMRMKEKKLEPDYNLSGENFIVYVPKDYTAQTPPGILLLLNYKNSSAPSDGVLAFCDAHDFIFVTPVNSGQEAWVKCGVGLDAIYNLQKQYAVDEHRVYLLDFDQSKGGQALAFLYPDVIQGSFICNAFKWWRSISSKAGTYAPEMPAPSQQYVGKAKLHPLIIANTEKPDDYFTLKVKALSGDGFRHVKTMIITSDQVHYPNYTTDWMEEAIKFLEENNTIPAAKNATRPLLRPATNPLVLPR